MVVVPSGSFMMGSIEAERRWLSEQGIGCGWGETERPQRKVTIRYPFTVGRYPITFEEYDRFAEATCRDRPDDAGWGRDHRPVINVSWDDSKAYVEWLSKETGQPYRLLTEAEWEYVCRAGTTTRYWWGDDIIPDNANYGRNIRKTTEVGTYLPNPWGLHDTHGNVWEWVEDCWNDSYEGAPDDGSAWKSGNCNVHVLRGGSCFNERALLRSASRTWSSFWFDFLGFRVGRSLSPGEISHIRGSK